MVPNTLALGRRRFQLVFVATLVVAAIASAAPGRAAAATAPSSADIAAEELKMVNLLNGDRAAAGLIAVRTDSRLMAIARARSADMIAKNYFSHTQPDGRNVFDILSDAGITWYTAGEIIAWNNYPWDSTTSTANNQWMNSSGHRAIILSTDMNYVGVGLAVDSSTGKKMWTEVFMKGPDRTGARATMAAPTLAAGTTSTNRKASLSWGGADIRLQVLTAGLRNFTVQRRVDGGSWVTVWSNTTLRGGTLLVTLKHKYEFRVSALDNKGNRGSWVTTVIALR